MLKTWRWFGHGDPGTLPMLRQIGVEGIVTALHDIPNGQVWPLERIEALKKEIESYGMRWSVAESLPVSEAIKYAGPERDALIENYRISLANMGKAGVRTICYNFMPVIDWIRTDLEYPCPDGATTLFFDKVKFAYFDIYIIGRKGVRDRWDAETLAKVDALAASISQEEIDKLVYTIIVKTQGFINGNVKEGDIDPVGIFRRLLAQYDGISKAELRANLKYFLEAIMPVCDEYGIDMCIHPDDPPMQVLGLPRIVTDADDIRWLLNVVPDPHNALTFCAGSLSSGAHNDCVAMARGFASRTRFVHLRSCEVFTDGNFTEAPHTAGRANLVELVRIFERRNPSLPMRVDHGRMMLGDESKGYNPGYGFHGRMLALGQVEGMMAAVRDEIKQGLI